MKKEFNLEILLQIDFKDILEEIAIDSDLLLKLEELNLTYNQILKTLTRLSSYDINRNIDLAYVSGSYRSSMQIEDKKIADVNIYHNINKLNVSYNDINIINGFYYNFNTNIKKINRLVSDEHPGLFRNEINKHATINTPRGNLLIANNKNIAKYLSNLVNLNLLRGNNVYVEAWVIHCLFQAIQPFCDGNGHVGRFILNNHLNQQAMHKTYLDKTILKYRTLYNEALFDFQVKQDFEGSMHKFLELLVNDREESIKIIQSYITNYQLLQKLISRDDFLNKYAENIIAILFTNQIISKKEIYKILNKSEKTNKKILDYLVKYNYLTNINETLYQPCY